MRARYRRQVTAQHVGQRVTIRRWVDDPERGPVPSDVVGRLVSWDDDGRLVIRRRDDQHVEVAASDILASRVVPDPPTKPDD